jgi:hypothetical protein
MSDMSFLPRVCKANATTAHSLLHWRYHLNEWVLGDLAYENHTSAEKIIERESWSIKKRRDYANKVVDKMAANGDIDDLWRDFKMNMDTVREAKVCSPCLSLYIRCLTCFAASSVLQRPALTVY